MASSKAEWFRDPDVLIDELLIAGHGPAKKPELPGYEDVREIRRGGQGVVFSAIQRSTKRRVAIKVLLDGSFASAAGRRRFEREIDLVAALRHPNIISVYDSGATADGHLYYVMEYVDGLPLDDHLAASGQQPSNRSAIEARLQLFLKICGTVNHAHQRGVIHRDLKPGNILIDREGEPRVCDFGLAKIKADDASGPPETRVMSVTGQFMGSLPWASPEQLEGNHARVDVRTDVYSLGVILYQLLTGRFPYGVSGSIHDVFKNIMSSDPPRVSSISQGVDADLDVIVQKCLAKDMDRRYQGAGDLLRDIRRHLAGEPIEARRDSTWYVFRRTLKRHRTAAIVSAVVAITITSALIVSLWSWRGAAIARDDAQRNARERAAIGDFLQRMLTSVDPGRDGRNAKVMDVLDRASADIHQSFKNEPALEAKVRQTLGSSYAALGLFEKAEAEEKHALELAALSLGEQHRTSLELGSALTWAIANQGRLDEAETLARGQVERTTSALGPDDPLTLQSKALLGEVLNFRGMDQEAEAMLRETLAAQRRAGGDGSSDIGSTLSSLGVLLKKSGRLQEAEGMLRESLGIVAKIHGETAPLYLTVKSNLSLTLQSEGRLEESEQLQREVLEVRMRVLGETHMDTLITMSNLATLLMEQGRTADAVPILERVVDIEARVIGPNEVGRATAINNLAKAYQDIHEADKAEALFQQAIDIRRKGLGPDHPYTLTSLANLAALYDQMQRYSEAEPLYRETLASRRRTLGDDDFNTAISENNLATLLLRTGKAGEAEALAAEAVRVAHAKLPTDHYAIGLFQGNHGRCLIALGRYEEAEAELEKSATLLGKAFGDEDPRTAKNIGSLIESLEKNGKSEKADAWRRRLPTTQPGL